MELKLLLEFLARPQQEQWHEIPNLTEPVQVRADDFEFVTRMPRMVLGAILVSLLLEFRLSFPAHAEVLEEIRVLLYPWMMESNLLEVFAGKEELGEADVIWRTVARLCKLALEAPELSQIVTQDITVAQLVSDYSTPVDPEQWVRFPIH